MFFFRKKEKQSDSQINILKIIEVENLPIYSRRPDSYWLTFIPKASKTNADVLLSIVKESADQVNRTLLPIDFFENWNVMFYTLKKLITLESKVRFRGDLPHVLLEKCKIQYEASTFEFLDRYAAYRWKEKIEPLKTERGKLNRNKKFLEEILPYWKDMTEDSQMRACELQEVEKALILTKNQR